MGGVAFLTPIWSHVNENEKKKQQKKKTRGPRTLELCLIPAVGMTNGNFLQTCIKNSLLNTMLSTSMV